MLDTAEQVFNLISQQLILKDLAVAETFGSEDIIHVIQGFEGQENVEVLTFDDFLTRCYEIGVQELS